MRQFDVVPTRALGPAAPFVVVLQHDAVDQQGTVVVAPCIPARMGPKNRRLTPEVEIDGDSYVVVVGELAGISRTAVAGKAVANFERHRDAFTAAIDLLFTGY